MNFSLKFKFAFRRVAHSRRPVPIVGRIKEEGERDRMEKGKKKLYLVILTLGRDHHHEPPRTTLTRL